MYYNKEAVAAASLLERFQAENRRRHRQMMEFNQCRDCVYRRKRR